MAAITRTKGRPVTPVGYEVNDVGTVTEDITAGDLLQLGSSGWSKCLAGEVEAHGIALKDYYSGQGGCDVGIQGEMDGFSGLAPGAALWPSPSVAGGIDTAAPENSVAVNEQQVITLADAAGADTFTLTFSGQTTTALNDDETAANVQAALIALSNVAPGDVTVAGANGGPFTATFAGAYAGQDVPLMSGTGTGCTVTVEETVLGRPSIAAPPRIRASSTSRIRYNFV